MKLRDIGNSISKACNWAFNNNGIEVDPSLIRLCDGSPVHSTGTTRLRSKWPYALAFAPLVISANLSDEKVEPIDFLLPAFPIAMIGFNRFLQKDRLIFHDLDENTLCINKNPDRNVTQIPSEHFYFAEDNYSINTKFSACSLLASTFIYEFLSLTADNLRISYTYRKVTKGDWAIEKIPPPKMRISEPEIP